ncbi:uncharacterized protein RSE6_09145 [Rhynchosporium secalis]|uniref:Uncharacterized protein n=1 Tax=Rhynchosporium secalis TaxID=38038 RepID=A0A1E1MH95_RHYSE|nr:uncharacterized protein RSE6_09145 [Rhynchosporium secalis]
MNIDLMINLYDSEGCPASPLLRSYTGTLYTTISESGMAFDSSPSTSPKTFEETQSEHQYVLQGITTELPLIYPRWDLPEPEEHAWATTRPQAMQSEISSQHGYNSYLVHLAPLEYILRGFYDCEHIGRLSPDNSQDVTSSDDVFIELSAAFSPDLFDANLETRYGGDGFMLE